LKISYDVGPVGAWFEVAYSLEIAVEAERAGFDAIWFGDHILPWFHTHAHAPQAWIWLTAAMKMTKSVPVGTCVTVPMFRYHPIIVAQALSTLSRIGPGRVLFAVGTGEAINEAPFLQGSWPGWAERAETLVEALTLIRKFWSSESYFDHDGMHFKVKGLFCYDKPAKPIPVFWSAYGPKSARLGGLYADHLLTYGTPDAIRKSVLPEFERGVKESGRDPARAEKVVYLDGGYGDMNRLVKKFRINAGATIPENTDKRDPREIEASAKALTKGELVERAFLFTSPDEIIDRIEVYKKIGINHVVFGDWGYDPRATLRMFKKHIIAAGVAGSGSRT
jgi:coenzyme F420-dependent glucose-6-phosphate dehydrogenase